MANMRPTSRTLLKVVILGDGGVGKSCLMNRFVSNRYDENNFHTIGVEFMNKEIVVDGEKFTLQIWDTAGQERFRALRTPFYRGSDICLLCYAVDDRDTFLGLKQWRDEFRNYADIKVETFPFIVVGNKNDLSARHRQVQFDEVQSWCAENGISSHIETSSKAATNITEAFMLAVRQWKNMERAAEADLRRQNSNDIIDLTKRIRLAQNRFCCYGSNSSEARGPGVGDSDTEDEYMNSTAAPAVATTPRRFGMRPAKQEPVRYEL